MTRAWTVSTGDFADNGDARYTLDGIKTIGKADARLISAAPDLLAALDGLVNPPCHAPDFLPSRLWDAARAAIAKATGEGT